MEKNQVTRGNPATHSLGVGLRSVRQERGWSLQLAATNSRGIFSASALGSYERDQREISALRLKQLADLYEVPIQAFFAKDERNLDKSFESTPLRFDLLRLHRDRDQDLEVVSDFLSMLTHYRGDWNGQIISIRSSDVNTLALLLRKNPAEVVRRLNEKGLLLNFDGGLQN